MPCNTQRVVKKARLQLFTFLGCVWSERTNSFCFNEIFQVPIQKGFYLLSLKRLFSAEKKGHQHESSDICQGTNTEQTQEKGVEKPRLTWVIRGGLTRGWQWRRGSALCAGNSAAAWEPGLAPSRCGGTQRADSAWGWKVWRQEINTGRKVSLSVSLSQNCIAAIWRKSKKQANKLLLHSVVCWDLGLSWPSSSAARRRIRNCSGLPAFPALAGITWSRESALGHTSLRSPDPSDSLPSRPAVFTTLENSVLGKPRAPGTGSSEQGWNVDKSHQSTGRDIPRDTVSLQEENTLCNNQALAGGAKPHTWTFIHRFHLQIGQVQQQCQWPASHQPPPDKGLRPLLVISNQHFLKENRIQRKEFQTNGLFGR